MPQGAVADVSYGVRLKKTVDRMPLLIKFPRLTSLGARIPLIIHLAAG